MPVDLNRATANRITVEQGLKLPWTLPQYELVPADDAHCDRGRFYNRQSGKPIRASIEFGVLHNTEGWDSVYMLSTDPATAGKKSINTLIRRSGSIVYIVPPGDTAWHVGQARAPYSNTNCIGVELENLSNSRIGKAEPYPMAQIRACGYWIATIMYSFGLPWSRWVRHGDIAIPFYGADNPKNRRADPSFCDLAILRDSAMQWLDFLKSVPQQFHPYFFI